MRHRRASRSSSGAAAIGEVLGLGSSSTFHSAVRPGPSPERGKAGSDLAHHPQLIGQGRRGNPDLSREGGRNCAAPSPGAAWTARHRASPARDRSRGSAGAHDTAALAEFIVGVIRGSRSLRCPTDPPGGRVPSRVPVIVVPCRASLASVIRVPPNGRATPRHRGGEGMGLRKAQSGQEVAKHEMYPSRSPRAAHP